MTRRGPLPIVAFLRKPDNGYSLPELMLTMGLIAVVSAIAVVQIGTAQQAIRGDSAMRLVLVQLGTARELAISERRDMRLNFLSPNALQVIRQDVPSGTTVKGAAIFEGRAEYHVVPGLPDTPDAFGNRQAIDFGSATTVTFTSDGTVVDQIGNPVNGTVFLAIPGQPVSARAITVLGSTGRIRAYRWDGRRWVRV